MRAAVVQQSDNIVVNICIINSMDDPAPEGCFFVDVDNVYCNIGWLYDPQTGTFSDPNPPPPEETPVVTDGGGAV